MATVAMGMAGNGGAFSIVTVLAEEITGSETLSGIAAAGMTTGAAIVAVPLARLMARSGRRVGLRSGYLLALGGAILMLLATMVDNYALVVVGMAAVGVGSACGLAARFAVVDLVEPAERARTIGLLVGATTLGAVAGPTLATGPFTAVATALGLEELAGPFLFAAVVFVAASLIVDRGLRPDPLLVARRIGGGADAAPVRSSLARSLRIIGRLPPARLATVAMMVGQGVMVATMVMTPLHMTDGDQSLRIIGFVISVHIVGMYALSPLVGWATGRIGPTPMIIVGGVISFTGAEIAAYMPPHVSWGMFAGMFGVGLGWNCCLVAGTASVHRRRADRGPCPGAGGRGPADERLRRHRRHRRRSRRGLAGLPIPKPLQRPVRSRTGRSGHTRLPRQHPRPIPKSPPTLTLRAALRLTSPRAKAPCPCSRARASGVVERVGGGQ